MRVNKLGQTKDRKFIFHADPGHGWLGVKKTWLTDLGIADKITSYSYERGNMVYLEEDCDATTFHEAYKLFVGRTDLKFSDYTVESFVNHNHPIKSYTQFHTK